MASLRIIFMGTADLARFSLEALLGHPDWLVPAVVTQPDRPAGRDLKLRLPPIKEAGLALQLPVLQPAKAKEESFFATLAALNPDLIVVMAYGQILPRRILDLPKFGCINVHTSLLPKYRGAAPIQRAILNDEPETGVTIMRMDAGLDTGDIISQKTTPITADDTSESLHERLGRLGADLLVASIPDYISGHLVPSPQPAEATYAAKIAKADGRVQWSRPARVAWNQVRALRPWPTAFCFLPAQPHPQLIKIWKAEVRAGSGKPGEVLASGKDGIQVACSEGVLNILELQREGGKRLGAREFLAGSHLAPGLILL